MNNEQRQVTNSATGAALVVGAGIGGIQASLDLAEAGFKVYLLDKSPAIGGTMAQLDKTFPTNDCAMCILSPKLVECGRHLNVEVMTYAELESVVGEPGNFTARVRQKPRYVVVDECTGCGDCAAVCPITRSDLFNVGLSERQAVYRLYPQAIPNAYVIEKHGRAPCRDACPTGQRAQGYIALIREGRFADAYRAIKEDNPFPAVCGRVCNHVCEDACSRGKVDEPVSIMALKRFVTDWAFEHPEEVAEAFRPKIEDEEQAPEPTGKRVAIVGSGPAGLTVAQDLKLKGHAVTVLEALPVAGGMMRVGIPAYRLPYDLLQREIDEIVSLGIDLKLNTRVDDVVALKDDGYDAVFVGIGAHAEAPLRVTGVDLPQVLSAVEFLRDASLERYPDLMGKNVIVLGGGDVAMDAVCTALRIGTMQADENGGSPPKVRIAYRRTEAEMPAREDEIRQAKEDGVIFDWLVSPVEMTANEQGNVCSLSCIRMELGEPDESGRRRPIPIEGSEFLMDADVVISAIGARPNLECTPESIERTSNGRQIAVDENTMMTSVEGVFAAGDAVTGMAFVVDAIGAGHKAAWAMDAYLRGEPIPAPLSPSLVEGVPVAELTEEDIARKRAAGEIVESVRACTLEVSPDERIHSLCEVCGPMTEEQAIAEANRCLQCGVCSECNQCVYACQKHCIDHDMREEIVELNVGAVVLVPGLETTPGDIRPELGYGRLPNVVTSIEFERMLSASGPWGGVVQRPSDGAHPRKVAFIQCVGSRDISCNQGYCSSVCCMYATKEAIIAKEHSPDVEPTIFYMDIRSFGKGFERYVERAEQEHGVRYVRSMVSMITDVPGTSNLRVRHATPDGKNVEEEFDLVVLSVGLKPPEGTRELAEQLGVGLNEYSFAESPSFRPAQTTRPGIFVAGPFNEPKDIPETVVEASCAAAQASALLANARGTLTEERVWPDERDVDEEDPRVGVFICHCGINIGAVVDVPDVVKYVTGLPDVVYAEENLYTCSQDTQERIRELIEEHGLNRVVVASCTPRTHEPLFQETIRGAGLNPHLFQLANIREQDSWVHRDNHKNATEKAKELVRMAVAKSRQLCPLERGLFDVNHSALVIGGGLAGMTAALSIVEQGFEVTLVEREAELGGNLRHIYTPLPGSEDGDPQALLKRMIEAVSANPHISVLAGAEVVDMGGYLGQYRSTVRLADGRQKEIEHGATIVATGAQEIEPREYLYGQDERIITQRELERRTMNSEYQIPNSIVMIQCVGSRDEEHPYCSRICCTEAIKNALAVKECSPETDVYILYRDIRTFGFKERYYREARQKGVIFLQYDKDQKPEVQIEDGRLCVDVMVQPDGETFTLNADLVVLSAGIEPNVDNETLAQRLKVPLNEDGFFLEAHVKLRPLDFAADGVYLCGLAHSPHFLDETIAQAQGAAVRVVSLLAMDQLDATPIVACVDPLLCTACGLCVEVCPYGARVLEPGASHAEVIEVLCQGCGACITACPNKASQQKGFGIGQVYQMLDAMDSSW